MTLLLLIVLLFPSLAFATPYPVSNEVQRTTPARCPNSTIPSVNSQGSSGAPLAVTTAAKVIPGNGNRQVYSFLSDADFCAEYGTITDTAPVTTPVGGSTCVAGELYKANVLYIENVYPGNRLDVACLTGTCHIYTVECNP